MYTSTAAQHLLSQSSLAPHLLPHSSLKFFAWQSSWKPRSLPRTSISHLFSFSPSSTWIRNFPVVRALGYNDRDDKNDGDDDDVYVKSFRQSGGVPMDGEPSGFKAGFKSERGGRDRGGRVLSTRGGRDTAAKDQGFSANSSSRIASRGRGRGRGGNATASRGRGGNATASLGRGGNAVSRGAGEKPNNGLVLDEATGGMVEYRHPDWKEDPKAARKAKREPAVAPQVRFEAAMSKQPHIAILGGGMAGLVCALTLEEHGIRSTVFDTGKHGLGGRMATREVHIREGLSLVFDHAAQYFTVSDPKFRKLVDRWIKEGAVKEWKGVVGNLQAGGTYSGLADDVPRYVGTHGMRPLADHMVSQGRLIDVKRPVWISNMDAKGPLWHLNENGKPHGEYDAVVIAHNGKCANRLLAPSGAPQVFKQMKRLELSSIWALMAAFDEALPIPEGLGSSRLDGAFVEGVNSLSWMANNSGKLDNTGKDAPHCWTFFSTAAYGKKNKVPQESIPAVKAERVRREMLQGVGTALGLPEGSMPTPFFTKLQLWGAGLPTNSPGVPCIFDSVGRVGICGDWLLGSSLEAAALSGMALAEHIADFRDRGEENPEEFSVGLEQGLSQVQGKDIGQFPGSPALEPRAPQELVGSVH